MVMWQKYKCVLRFVWWGCSASNVNCVSLQERDGSVQQSHASESFQDRLHFLPFPDCLTLYSFKAMFSFCRAFPSFSSFALAFCRYEGAPTQVLPGSLRDWQTMKDLVISFSCFFASKWLNSLCRSSSPQPNGAHLLSMPFQTYQN